MTSEKPVRVAVDTGGTFTDVLLEHEGRWISHKCPSTPSDPSIAIYEGIRGALRAAGLDVDRVVEQVIHGTTVGTNALLERRGARVLFVATEGFEDLLLLGRQNRPSLYALAPVLPKPLVDARDCVGVRERVCADGSVERALDDAAISELIEQIEARFRTSPTPEAVAICFLHAYANADHEARVASALRERFPSLHVTCSSRVLPEFREYERASTTAADAFTGPMLRGYLERLVERLSAVRLRVMQSNGGVMGAREAGEHPVHLALSGPAGGVLGGLRAAQRAGEESAITFDMGGTSTDVALCIDGAMTLTTSGDIGGVPVRVPMVDVHTVGAGGGSIARVDLGGALKVGPESAGAAPGPACYGRGTLPTVTDANLLLGRLVADDFLGGAMSLDVDRARAAVDEHVARVMGVSVEEAAAGIVEVTSAAMARAVKVISLERGHDPRGLTLVAFGGAGAMHACSLAEHLGMRRVLVPPSPGLLSAAGMLQADVVRHVSRTLLTPLDSAAALARAEAALSAALDALDAEATRFLEREEVPEASRVYEASLDLRYRGQSFELQVAISRETPRGEALSSALEAFESLHERRYGYAMPGRVVELVNVRLCGRGLLGSKAKAPTPPSGERPEVKQTRMFFDGGWRAATQVTRSSLPVGYSRDGPLVVTEYSSTTVVAPGWRLRVLESKALSLNKRLADEM